MVVFDTAVLLGSVNINKIVNENVGDGNHKSVKVEEIKNDGDHENRNKTVNTWLFDQVEGDRG